MSFVWTYIILTFVINNFIFLGLIDNIEVLAPDKMDQSVEWSVSVSNIIDAGSNSSDEEDEDQEDVFGTSCLLYNSDSDDGIVFEQDNNDDWSDTESSKDVRNGEKAPEIASNTSLLRIQFLYIQMEFCEKSTLRDVINAGGLEIMSIQMLKH